MKGRYLYIPVRNYNELNLFQFPSTGRNGNIQGMRKLFWGDDAYVIKCGAYAYKVDAETFEKAIKLKNNFTL